MESLAKKLLIHWKSMVPYVHLSTNFGTMKLFTVIKLSNPEFVDNCTNGIIVFVWSL